MNCKLISVAILFLFATSTNAQKIKVNFIVKNEKAEIIQNCTAKLLTATDSLLVGEIILKDNNAFVVEQNKVYLLTITAIDVQAISKKIVVKNRDTSIVILVKRLSKNLDEVVVTSVKPLVRQEDDKTIIDAEPIAVSSTNALEVLEKTPGAIVDQDGNVYLNSATPATIFLNGRELKMSAADVASMLKSLPANSISKIEILRNPSAKFDAASSGGIVNIVLKKGTKIGTNGTVDVSHFQGVYATENIGFNVNKNDSKLNTYLSYNFTNRINFQQLSSERPLANTVFIQSSFTKLPTNTNYASAGIDYEINKKWNINFDTKFTANNNRSELDNDINIVLISNRNNTIAKNQSLVSNTGPTFYWGNTLSTKCKIDSAGSEWTNSFDYSYFKANNNQLYNNLATFPISKFLLGDGSIVNNKNIIGFKSDVVLKTKQKITYEFGTKLNFSNGGINSLYFADSGLGKYRNNFQTNKYDYKENILSLYFQAAKTFAGFTFKPGVRLEHTDIIGNQIIPTVQTFTIKRTDIFPYIFIRHNIAKVLGFKLIGTLVFRKSITRPYYEALNPFPKYVDQYTFDIGNPDLKPQLTNNYEFSVNANDFPIFSAGINDIKNIFTSLTYSKADTLFRTYDNLGSNKEFYMRLVGGIPPGKKYFFYLVTQMNAINYKGIYNEVPFKYSRASWNIFTFHSYKVSPTLNVSLNAWMRINGVNNFFETKNFGTLNITANKSTLHKKLNIILTLNDILRTNVYEFNIDVPKFTGNGIQFTDTKRIGIALKYNFGQKPKVEKKQGFDIPQDAIN